MSVKPDLWVAKRFCCDVLDMSTNNFDDRVRPRIAAEFVKGDRRGLLFHLPTVVKTWHAYQVSLQAKQDVDADPLMSGAESPGLERYRMAKAQLAERDLALRDTLLIDRNKTDDALRTGIVAMRDTGDRLIRRFGNEAGEIFNDAVTEFESIAIKAMSPADDD